MIRVEFRWGNQYLEFLCSGRQMKWITYGQWILSYILHNMWGESKCPHVLIKGGLLLYNTEGSDVPLALVVDPHHHVFHLTFQIIMIQMYFRSISLVEIVKSFIVNLILVGDIFLPSNTSLRIDGTDVWSNLRIMRLGLSISHWVFPNSHIHQVLLKLHLYDLV